MNLTEINSFVTNWTYSLLLILLITGCDMLESAPSATTTPTWTDASSVMQGVCFEAANDAAGQVFILRDANDLSQFYDLADHSELCRHPVTRQTFDFDQAILAGLWSKGVGCTAQHEVLAVEQDDTLKIFHMRLRFITEGDCNYELVRPFWAALSIPKDYTVDMLVEG